MAEIIVCYDSTTGERVGKLLDNSHIAAAAAIAYSKLALSGQLVANDIVDGAVVSAKIGSGEIGPHIAAAAILSAHMGAGIIAAPHLAALGITSGYLGNDAIPVETIVLSGILTKDRMNLSGRVTATDLEPGTSVDISEQMVETNLLTAQAVSAQCVYISLSGYVDLAGAEGAASGTLPAIGYVASGIASGIACRVDTYGLKLWSLSGAPGDILFVGSGGLLTVTAPNASGEIQQRMGRVAQQDGIWLMPSPDVVQVT